MHLHVHADLINLNMHSLLDISFSSCVRPYSCGAASACTWRSSLEWTVACCSGLDRQGGSALPDQASSSRQCDAGGGSIQGAVAEDLPGLALHYVYQGCATTCKLLCLLQSSAVSFESPTIHRLRQRQSMTSSRIVLLNKSPWLRVNQHLGQAPAIRHQSIIGAQSSFGSRVGAWWTQLSCMLLVLPLFNTSSGADTLLCVVTLQMPWKACRSRSSLCFC